MNDTFDFSIGQYRIELLLLLNSISYLHVDETEKLWQTVLPSVGGLPYVRSCTTYPFPTSWK